MINIDDRERIILSVEKVMNDVFLLLEENRFEPAGRGAGTAPTKQAERESVGLVLELVERLGAEEIEEGSLTTPYSFGEIMGQIKSVQDNNIADKFKELQEIDSFTDTKGETKYIYHETVYLHAGSGQHILVSDKREAGGYGDTLGISVSIVEKKERISYEWL